MRICIIGKIPPVQGGTPRETFYLGYHLAKAGHEVHIVTNSLEIEAEYRIFSMDYFDELNPGFCNEAKNLPLYIHSTKYEKKHYYIPQGNPIVTKLTSLAISIVENKKFDLIFAYYLEPYAIVASLVSEVTGVPYVIKHAGSDIDRLFTSDALNLAYKHILKKASAIITSPNHLATFIDNDIPLEKMTFCNFSSSSLKILDDERKMDFKAYLSYVKTINDFYIQKHFKQFFNYKIDYSLPIIGVYGKTNPFKGHIDLVKSLGLLKKKGKKFNLIGLIQGPEYQLEILISHLKSENIFENTCLLPYIPHWHMSSFINACHAVCFLERNFPVECHMPFVPCEVLQSGKCLVLSKEIYDKIKIKYSDLKNDVNLLITDPENHLELAGCLEKIATDPEKTKKIGQDGKKVYVESDPTERISKQFKFLLEKAKNNQAFMRGNKSLVLKGEKHKKIYTQVMMYRLYVIYQRSFSYFGKELRELNKQFIAQLYPRKTSNLKLIQLYLKFILSNLNDSKNSKKIIENIRFDNLYFTRVLKIKPIKTNEIVDHNLSENKFFKLNPFAEIARFSVSGDQIQKNFNLSDNEKESYFCFKPRNGHHGKGVIQINKNIYELLKLCKHYKSTNQLKEFLGKGNEISKILSRLCQERIIVSTE
ncbi:MAG: glycosyltransferase [Gammaproteobacteria bacterium]